MNSPNLTCSAIVNGYSYHFNSCFHLTKANQWPRTKCFQLPWWMLPAFAMAFFICFHFKHPVSRVIEFGLLGGSSPLMVLRKEKLTVANDLLFPLLSACGTYAQHSSHIREHTYAVTFNMEMNQSSPVLLPWSLMEAACSSTKMNILLSHRLSPGTHV